MSNCIIIQVRRLTISYLLILLFNSTSVCQSWEILSNFDSGIIERRDIIPEKYSVYKLDDEATKKILLNAPHESKVTVANSESIIQVPDPNGNLEAFRVVNYTLIEKPLSDTYNEFKTLYGIGVYNKTKKIRIDYTIRGFRAVVSSSQGNYFVDHYQRNDNIHRIVYWRSDLKNNYAWNCDVETDGHFDLSSGANRQGDCQFRTYRLAQATTGEYSTFHGGTEPQVLSAVITTINRVNEVYEQDLATRFILIGNTNSLFYYDAGTDPYTNNNGSTMLGQNQTNCDLVIGNGNYDLGHVFSTGGGGVASLNALCNNSSKARGVTGSGNPVGDAFDIDYVAHEMGHQCGGNHTFNNSCGGNRNNATAFEPGSGNTIMAYAGICPPDMQPHSDPYFHAISVQEINVRLVATTACANILSWGNTKPTVPAISNYTIPKSTPFFLSISPTDPDGDALTTDWEQMDNQIVAMPPQSSNTGGPAFRSLNPNPSPTRYFPALDTVLANQVSTWEVLPSVARTMNFRATVRDFHTNGNASGGCTSEVNSTVTTASNAGPFMVTTDNGPSTWTEQETRTITWDVSNTNVSPVSCENVEISLSIDGGHTYPEVLLPSTPNDGSASIVVPLGTMTTARVRVRGVGNVFYDVNNTNITILPGIPSFSLTLDPSVVSVCETEVLIIDVDITSVLGFDSPVNLSISGVPSGVIASFGSTTLNPGNSTTLTVSNLIGLNGTFNLVITGSSGSIVKTANLAMSVFLTPATPTLNTPLDNATNVSLTPTMVWNTANNATSYDLEISNLPDFSQVTYSANSANTNHVVASALTGSSPYYWRVRGKSGGSCLSSWSSVRTFTTKSCFVYNSTNVPVDIPSSGTPIVFSNLSITDRGTINDMEILDLIGTHTYVSDLRFSMSSPNNTTVIFWNSPCTNQDNFDINFDDQAANSNWPCPPIDGLTYKPSSAFTPFINTQMKGNWTMKIEDLFNQDGGSLNSWALHLCVDDFCRLKVDNTASSGAGSLLAAINCAVSGDTITFDEEIQNTNISFGNSFAKINKDLAILADPSKNIIVSSTSNAHATFEIDVDKIAVIQGLKIKSSNINNGAIENQGISNLENITLFEYTGSTSHALKNFNKGNTIINGELNIIKE